MAFQRLNAAFQVSRRLQLHGGVIHLVGFSFTHGFALGRLADLRDGQVSDKFLNRSTCFQTAMVAVCHLSSTKCIRGQPKFPASQGTHVTDGQNLRDSGRTPSPDPVDRSRFCQMHMAAKSSTMH